MDGHNTHDLLPLPYTEEALDVVCRNIGQAQDALGRPMLFENPSSYVSFPDSALTEWEFLAEMTRRTGCYLLLDANNIHVSAVNHGFDADAFLAGIPAERVRQIHLAGYTPGEILIDTHDREVCDEVWGLYTQAVARFGHAATMIERDDNIPPLADLLAELDRARAIAARGKARRMNLAASQRAFQAQVLDEDIPLPDGWAPRMAAGLAVYRNAYRARLVEALKDSFSKTLAWVGEEPFSRAAGHYFITCPPSAWTLDMTGAGFADTLGQLFANDPEVAELAWLEWAMHCAYVAGDCMPIDAEGFAAATARFEEADWSDLRLAFVPGLACRPVWTACVAIWKFLAEEAPQPEDVWLAEPAGLMVWREGLSPVFRSASALEAECLDRMREGASFGAICEFLASQHGTERAAAEAGAMLGRWIDGGLIEEVAPGRA